MSPLERSGSKVRRWDTTESQFGSQEDLERFGNTLWRGPALEVAEPTVIHNNVTRTSFILESKHLPFDGDIPSSVLSQLSIHMRSRYAHAGLDVPVQHASRLYGEQRIPKNGERETIELSIIKHCPRPVELPKGAKPFHFFLVPPAAYIQGEELETIVGSEEGKTVYIQGHKERDWSISYETISTGERLATGLFLKIDPEERFWIPASEEPIRLPDDETTTFQEIREMLLAHTLKKIDDPEFPMPKNGMWIGRCPHLTLGSNTYVKLDNEAYEQDNGEFRKVGMQTHSPLLEGGRTKHHPHVEIRGSANWVRATVIRNEEVAKPG